jgi:hypothetical protein
MEQQINLYQPILGAEQRLFSARAIALAALLFVTCLVGIWGYAGWRVRNAERALAALEAKQTARTAAIQRELAALHGGASVEALETGARRVAVDIADREAMLATIRRGMGDVTDGFSAQLEALGRQQLEGLWLRRIVLTAGGGRLALVGAANDAQLVAQYLASLSGERVLGASRFDRFQLRRPLAGESAGATTFEVGDVPPTVTTGEQSR